MNKHITMRMGAAGHYEEFQILNNKITPSENATSNSLDENNNTYDNIS